ncbi:MAG TPA: class I SAM-dependent methyltransferase [Allosphingosinicella sp.]|nr:class I SAM-dependent methyltransferase [Allosphingosinicella sp.]
MNTTIYSDSTYLQKNESWHEEDSPYKVGLVAKILAANDIAFGSIADIGCGAGLTTELMARKYPHVTVHGYDVSPDAAGFWSRRTGENLQYFRTDFASSGRHYDVATCLDVFEHVEDYFGFIRAISRNATYVVFNVPLDMCVLKLLTPGIRRARERVGHLHYFNAYTATETIKDSGLEIVDSFLSNPFFTNLPRNPLQWLLLLPRMMLSLISKRLCSTLLGSHSMVILARQGPAQG